MRARKWREKKKGDKGNRKTSNIKRERERESITEKERATRKRK